MQTHVVFLSSISLKEQKFLFKTFLEAPIAVFPYIRKGRNPVCPRAKKNHFLLQDQLIVGTSSTLLRLFESTFFHKVFDIPHCSIMAAI